MDWISGFSLIKDGNFLFGSCGLGVNYYEYTASSIIRPLMMQRLAHICTTFQGTEWNLPTEFERRLFCWNSIEDDIVPQIPRVSWLTLLGPQCLKFLDKKNIFLKDRLDKSCVKQYVVGASSIVRAGEDPTYGGPFGIDSISIYRHVAETLMPLQMQDICALTCDEYSWARNWQYFL